MPCQIDPNRYVVTELEYRKGADLIRLDTEKHRGVAYEYLKTGSGYILSPKVISDRTVSSMIEYVFGKKVAIVGKGPSLDSPNLAAQLRGYGFIFCINQSIHIVDKLLKSPNTACMQLDDMLENVCWPQYGFIITRPETRHYYCKHPRLVTLDTVCDAHYGTAAALHICGALGAKSADLIAHDALLPGGVTEYAKCLDGIYNPSGKQVYVSYGPKFQAVADHYALPMRVVPT